MADDNKEVFKLDLDTKEFTAKANEALKIIGEIGEGDALSGLVSGLGSVAVAAGAVGTAFIAVKTAISLVTEAEEIKAINSQFEMLSKNAGLATDVLASGLRKAGAGLVDDTDLLKAANQGIVTLGANASKLPETLELARKVTALYGGELVDNFERLNQAIASGQTRALKQMGIIVDQKKAYEDYAKSIGVSVNALSEQGKQQAMLNAVLERGQKNFAGVNADLKEATNTITQIKVIFKDLGEAIALAFDKTMGPAVKSFLGTVKEIAGQVKTAALATFGEGAEKSAAQITELQLKSKMLNAELDRTTKAVWFGDPEKSPAVIGLKTRIAQVQAEIAALEQKKEAQEAEKKSASPAASAAAGPSGNSAVDLEKERKLNTAFEADMLKIKQERLDAEKKLVTDLAQVEDLDRQEKLLKEQQFSVQIQQIKDNENLSKAQKEQLLIEVDRTQKLQMLALEQELADKRAALYDNYQKHSTSVFDGISKAFQANALKQKKELMDFGKLGQFTFDTFASHATNSLMELGAGTKSATDIIKGFFFGMVGDMAQQYGQFMLLSSIWPPNPAGLAGGAALLVLAGFLKSQAGSSASSGGSTSASAVAAGSEAPGAASGITGGTESTSPVDSVNQNQVARKAVTIQIQGNYFETDQTKTKLMDMMRDATDATDFKYVQVGAR